jgi:hypothetical protein
MFWRALRVAFTSGMVLAIAASACGGHSSSSDDSSVAGLGGAGLGGGSHGGAGRSSGTAGKASVPTPVPCGDEMCDGISVPLAQLEVPGCCADARTNTCGIDTSALPMMASSQGLPACQPVAPAGKPDATCPSSATIPVMGIPVTAPGCCTPTGVCGYDLDRVGGFVSLGLGCVDSTPFIDGGMAIRCGGNAVAGEGGMGGAGPEALGDGGSSGFAASGAPGN